MIAICVGLVALSAMLAGFTITAGVWLHTANDERLNAADLLDGQRKLVAEYKSKYDTELVAHTVTSTQLKQERDLRGVAESQRNEAMRKTRELLRANLEHASDDEIRELVASAFTVALAVVPQAGPRRSDSAADGLLDPFADV